MAYLTGQPGVLRQYSPRSNWTPSRPTGLTMLHTTEFPPSWTVAQQADWLRTRTDPGCYHDIADIHGGDQQMVPYEFGAWQDGTGSNGMAMSIGFVCRTIDWAAMTPEARRRTLAAGARAFARQQAWLKTNGHPATPLRYITKAQSDAGMAGFCCHGWRDPGRRTDPGVTAPHLFPFDEWLDACRAALDGATDTDTPQEYDMPAILSSTLGQSLLVEGHVVGFGTPDDVRGTTGLPIIQTTPAMHNAILAEVSRRTNAVVVVQVANKAYFGLAGDRYFWIKEGATVGQFLAAGSPLVKISEAEHASWRGQFSASEVVVELSEVATGSLPSAAEIAAEVVTQTGRKLVGGDGTGA